jgi:putative phosphonate metabolism protein
MVLFRRYAVFWAPPCDSALARFGAGWLGWDAERGKAVAHRKLRGLAAPLAELTATPRRYGFHATLKPPFRLAEGTDLPALDDAVALLAADIAPFECPPLTLARLGPFCALVPSAPCPALSDLAAQCVTRVDRFRRQASDAELARRRATGLTPRQEALLARWGYPYVLDEFRFHLTLTGALDEAGCTAILDALDEPTAPFRANPLPIAEICLFGESESGNFHVIRRHALKRRIVRARS